MTFWNGVLWLHLIAMAFFVGGQLMLAAIVVPVLRGFADRGPMRSAARRFGLGTLLAVAVLAVTGAAGGRRAQAGPRGADRVGPPARLLLPGPGWAARPA